jgi:excisionase family DNA binding protein
MDRELFSSKEAARYLGMSVAFLERDRWAGARIAFVKIGRAVRYRRSELDRYIESRTRRSTSEAAA